MPLLHDGSVKRVYSVGMCVGVSVYLILVTCAVW